MKICTITCQNADNYGARLQCFALAYWLKKEGNEVEVIDYQPDYMREPNLWYIPSSVKELVKLFVRFPERLCSVKRHKIYSEFSKKYIPLTKVYNNSILFGFWSGECSTQKFFCKFRCFQYREYSKEIMDKK